jgi:hypothetical protein
MIASGAGTPSKVIATVASAQDAEVIITIEQGMFASPDKTIYIADSSGMANRTLCFTDDWMRAGKVFQFIHVAMKGALNVYVSDESVRADQEKVVIILDAAALLD